VSPVSPAAAAALYPQITKALGGATTLLYTARAAPSDLAIVLASPPVIVLGPRLVSKRAQSRSDADANADAELRFRIGRAVELARPHRVLAAGAGAIGFAHFVGGLRHAFGKSEDGVPVDAEVAREADRLRAALPLRLRTRLSEQLAAVSPEGLDPARYLAACQRAADRAGLLACGQIAVAVAQAGGASSARHLVELAASPAYLRTRRKLRGM
jgi:hypothetical protein